MDKDWEGEMVDTDLADLLLECARIVVAGGEIWQPGYRVAIEENPDAWLDALERAGTESEEARKRAEELRESLRTAAEHATAGDAMVRREWEELDAYEPDQDELFNIREKLGRKFTPEDVTGGLRNAAERLAKAYEGDFDFMIQMREEARAHRLTVGQAKGVLNSMTARRPARAPVAPTSRDGQRKPAEAITDGIYLHDGQVVKVQKAVHGSGQLYAKVLVLGDDDTFDMQHGYGHSRRAHFEYAKGLVYRLKVSERMTLEQAKEFGALYGVCCSCGATLTDETSIELGIGPVCRKRFA